MPKIHGQVTHNDFKAPESMHRIMREEMSDGQLSIIADYYVYDFAILGLEVARASKPNDIFTLCDENGPIKDI
jgi:hypothetical protein